MYMATYCEEVIIREPKVEDLLINLVVGYYGPSIFLIGHIRILDVFDNISAVNLIF